MIALMDDQVDVRREAFRRYMEAHGLKAGPWARASDLSQNLLYNFLNGSSQSLSQTTWEKLASSRNLTAPQLMNEIEAFSNTFTNDHGSGTQDTEERRQLENEAFKLFDAAPPEVQEALLTLLRHAVRGVEATRLASFKKDLS